MKSKENLASMYAIEGIIANKNLIELSDSLKKLSQNPNKNILDIILCMNYNIFTFCADNGYIGALFIIKNYVKEDVFWDAIQHGNHRMFGGFLNYLNIQYKKSQKLVEKLPLDLFPYLESFDMKSIKKNLKEGKYEEESIEKFCILLEESIEGFNFFLEFNPNEVDHLKSRLNNCKNISDTFKSIIGCSFDYAHLKLIQEEPLYGIIVQKKMERTSSYKKETSGQKSFAEKEDDKENQDPQRFF